MIENERELDRISEAYDEMLQEGATGDAIVKKLRNDIEKMIQAEIKKVAKNDVEHARLNNWVKGKLKFAWEHEK